MIPIHIYEVLLFIDNGTVRAHHAKVGAGFLRQTGIHIQDMLPDIIIFRETGKGVVISSRILHISICINHQNGIWLVK